MTLEGLLVGPRENTFQVTAQEPAPFWIVAAGPTGVRGFHHLLRPSGDHFFTLFFTLSRKRSFSSARYFRRLPS